MSFESAQRITGSFLFYKWMACGSKRMTTMNRSRNHVGVFSIVGLIAVLGITFGLDAFMAYLGQRSAQTFCLTYVILWTRALSFFPISSPAVASLLVRAHPCAPECLDCHPLSAGRIVLGVLSKCFILYPRSVAGCPAFFMVCSYRPLLIQSWRAASLRSSDYSCSFAAPG